MKQNIQQRQLEVDDQMKTIALISAAVVCLQIAAFAAPDSATTGPYNVSFDIGLPQDDYYLTVSDPMETETLGGDKRMEYSLYIRDNSSLNRFMMIKIKHLDAGKDLPIVTGSDWEYILDSAYENDPACINYFSDKRTIDSADGAVASMTHVEDSKTTDIYHALYQTTFDSNISVEIFSEYPWDGGTLQLLKTIHVEKIG